MLAVAAFNLVTFALTQSGMQLALAALLAAAGLMYMFGTVCVVEDDRVEVKNPLGMTLKTLRFSSPHDLQIDGRTLWVQTTDGERKKVSGMVANGNHWRALGHAIADAQAAAPRSAGSA